MNSGSRLITFTGKMGSGKTTAIDCIRRLQRKMILSIKLAQPLYDIQEYAYQRIENVYRRPDNFIKDRKLLQFLGTEWGREGIRDSLWIDIWKDEVSNTLQNYTNTLVITDDVRYDNEAKAVHELGGKVIKIESTRTDERINTKNGIVNHPSEVGVSPYLITATLKNDGTIDDLEKAILNLHKEIGLW